MDGVMVAEEAAALKPSVRVVLVRLVLKVVKEQRFLLLSKILPILMVEKEVPLKVYGGFLVVEEAVDGLLLVVVQLVVG